MLLYYADSFYNTQHRKKNERKINLRRQQHLSFRLPMLVMLCCSAAILNYYSSGIFVVAWSPYGSAATHFFCSFFFFSNNRDTTHTPIILYPQCAEILSSLNNSKLCMSALGIIMVRVFFRLSCVGCSNCVPCALHQYISLARTLLKSHRIDFI